MNFLQKQAQRRNLEAKMSHKQLDQSIFTDMDLKTANWSSNSPDQYAKEAYQKNVIAYRCIKEISDNIAGLEWQVISKRTGKVIDKKSKLLDLLKRPNPMQSQVSFFSRLESFKQIDGNTYMQVVGPNNGLPRELYILPPGKMKVIPGERLMIPKSYEYTPNSTKSNVVKFPVNQTTGASDIMHIKNFNPLDDWLGQSPIAAAAYSIDLHNEATEWNMRLLQNGARPSGALIAKMGLSPDQRTIAKESFDQVHGGPENAGRPMVFEGDLEWIDMMLTPRDMDYLESKNVAARDIAVAFRVPPILLNIGSDTTFANMIEARLSMVENTIIPEADLIQEELNHWLVPMFGDNILLKYNKDAIPAIMAKRSEIYAKLEKTDFLLINEKRKLAGFDALDEAQLKQLKEENVEKAPTEFDQQEFDKETSETNDHIHNYIKGDTKTSVTMGHSHKVIEL